MARYYGGCDVGSTTGKAVILGENGIVGRSIVASTMDPERTARAALDEACRGIADLAGADALAYLTGTGYGRTEVPFAAENVSEITCHAAGVHQCDPAIRTIVDIGGQDMKAIAVAEDGSVLEFAMNDKCAAGTGRFLEAMGRIFGVSLEEFSSMSLGAGRAIAVTAQCSVFAESEVVSLIAKRNPPADIAAGIQAAVAKRVFTLARRVGIKPRLTVSGGCAKNQGLVREIARVLQVEIAPLTVDPQLMGALGAAILARRKARG